MARRPHRRPLLGRDRQGLAARSSARCSIAAADDIADQDAFERKLYVIRRLIELPPVSDLAIPSFSSRTIVYKGMLTAPQLPRFFTDLRDPRAGLASGARPLALQHQHLPELGRSRTRTG